MNTNIYLKIHKCTLGSLMQIRYFHQRILGSAQIINKININPHLLRMDQYSKNCIKNEVSSMRY